MKKMTIWFFGFLVGAGLAFSAPSIAKWRGLNGGTLEDAFKEIEDLQDEVELQRSELTLVRMRLNNVESALEKRRR